LLWLEWLGMEKVGFVLTGLKWKKSVLTWLERLGMEEVGIGLPRMAWNGGCEYVPDWRSLEWRKLVLTGWNGLEGRKSNLTWPEGLEWRRSVFAWLEWLELSDVGFGLPKMALNVRYRFWPYWNGLQWRKLILAWPDWFPQHFVTVG
jgi:hypothetical protein